MRILINRSEHILLDSVFLSVRGSADRCGEKASFCRCGIQTRAVIDVFVSLPVLRKHGKIHGRFVGDRILPHVCERACVRGVVSVGWGSGSVRKVRVLVEMSIPTLGRRSVDKDVAPKRAILKCKKPLLFGFAGALAAVWKLENSIFVEYRFIRRRNWKCPLCI